jgi:hypothetical protein
MGVTGSRGLVFSDGVVSTAGTLGTDFYCNVEDSLLMVEFSEAKELGRALVVAVLLEG